LIGTVVLRDNFNMKPFVVSLFEMFLGFAAFVCCEFYKNICTKIGNCIVVKIAMKIVC
jgi:hypothetical protein